ncbi:ABC transporter permease [Terrabacter aerolatus]|uniref:Peptide ABC transporter permease n=1 Tax=Terrabacter aerolatus TaxID=422442 RepID=A0A512D5G9_9MICO|nr:ABC transporter permease [Terrabacter aerolatus]GEO31711.1 peptide ABC transporter permease [Terrabacter aerolatus]
MSEIHRDVEFGAGTTDETFDLEQEPETKKIEGRTPWQLARARLRRDRLSMIALTVATIVVVMAILAPILDLLGVLKPNDFNPELIDPALGGYPRGAFGGMSWTHPLGVEPGTGRDTLSRVVLGLTFSLIVAISATLIAVVVGTVLGLISGFLGHWADWSISRLADMVLAFPVTLMLLALSGMFIDIIGKVVPNDNVATGIYIVFVLGFFGWPTFARIIRGQVLSMREREFIEAARSLGASNRRIYFKELLPNLWAPILVYGTLVLPAYVSAEAALSFLGVGIKPPTPTLGNILANSVNYASSVPIFFLVPGLAIATVVLSFNLLGDGLRDALDPKADR